MVKVRVKRQVVVAKTSVLLAAMARPESVPLVGV